jgi:hypothetical protein
MEKLSFWDRARPMMFYAVKLAATYSTVGSFLLATGLLLLYFLMSFTLSNWGGVITHDMIVSSLVIALKVYVVFIGGLVVVGVLSGVMIAILLAMLDEKPSNRRAGLLGFFVGLLFVNILSLYSGSALFQPHSSEISFNDIFLFTFGYCATLLSPPSLLWLGASAALARKVNQKFALKNKLNEDSHLTNL